MPIVCVAPGRRFCYRPIHARRFFGGGGGGGGGGPDPGRGAGKARVPAEKEPR